MYKTEEKSDRRTKKKMEFSDQIASKYLEDEKHLFGDLGNIIESYQSPCEVATKHGKLCGFGKKKAHGTFAYTPSKGVQANLPYFEEYFDNNGKDIACHRQCKTDLCDRWISEVVDNIPLQAEFLFQNDTKESSKILDVAKIIFKISTYSTNAKDLIYTFSMDNNSQKVSSNWSISVTRDIKAATLRQKLSEFRYLGDFISPTKLKEFICEIFSKPSLEFAQFDVLLFFNSQLDNKIRDVSFPNNKFESYFVQNEDWKLQVSTPRFFVMQSSLYF